MTATRPRSSSSTTAAAGRRSTRRARLRGLRVAITPAADVYHDYDFDRNPAKRYLLERNRLIFVLTTYSSRMLAVLAPVLIATELGLLVLALREGWARDKVAGWR